MNLTTLTQQFIAETGLVPLIGAEVEFYLPAGADIAEYEAKLAQSGIETYGLERERGENQYELALKKPTTPMQAAAQVNSLKQLFLDGNFSAKPFADRPGSGLHIHISLHDKEGRNLFAKAEQDDESQVMRWAVAGLLNGMLEGFKIFAPLAESYTRFSAQFNNQEPDEGRYNNAPINVSWGGNNRTTALRIPASSAWPAGRHIEHRVAGSDADVEAVIGTVLLGVQHGLRAKKEPPEKLWGDAAHPQYAANLAPFPKTLEEAQKIYNKSGIYDALGL